MVLALLDTPLAGLLHACATGTLDAVPAPVWRDGAAVTVVVAAEGYPATPASGDEVLVGALPDGVEVLHAGTREVDGRVVSSGGRVLSVTAVGGVARAGARAGVRGRRGGVAARRALAHGRRAGAAERRVRLP